MKRQNNTILITGGSSGIGLELARVMSQRNNTVIICGRSSSRLDTVRQQIAGVHTFQCDISKAEDRLALFDWIGKHHPSCNILVNNAAIVNKTDFRTDGNIIQMAEQEIAINLLAPIILCKMFLPILEKNQSPVIANITTGLIYAPRAVYPIYTATKAGLHSFTQVLRHQLRSTGVKIVEVMMTVVDTPWHKGEAPKIAISPERAVGEMLDQLEKGSHEIRIGKVKLLYLLSRLAPSLAFRMINRGR